MKGENLQTTSCPAVAGFSHNLGNWKSFFGFQSVCNIVRFVWCASAYEKQFHVTWKIFSCWCSEGLSSLKADPTSEHGRRLSLTYKLPPQPLQAHLLNPSLMVPAMCRKCWNSLEDSRWGQDGTLWLVPASLEVTEVMTIDSHRSPPARSFPKPQVGLAF